MAQSRQRAIKVGLSEFDVFAVFRQVRFPLFWFGMWKANVDVSIQSYGSTCRELFLDDDHDRPTAKGWAKGNVQYA